MWAVGICERCGTVAAFRTTNPVVKSLMRGHSYYCPVCGMYKLLKIQAIPNAQQLDKAYNDLRVGIILESAAEVDQYNAQEAATEGLIKKYKDPNSMWWLDEDKATAEE